MEERLRKLEAVLGAQRIDTQPTHSQRFQEVENSGGKEMQLDMTFGNNGTKPADLDGFLTHYSIVDEINKERQVRPWTKPTYRALVLRKALRGTASDYVNQEAKLLSPWVRDDVQIIEKLLEKLNQP